MPNLSDWLGDTTDLAKPKALETAKALRKRKAQLDQAMAKPRAALAGEGNIFQRHRQGIDAIEAEMGR